ncbi:hypothetical protein [Deinococcus sp.]|uniref:hypothetical protein n=1 Tax=Deinococcus sp. TaxID=47478 RepID=UPI003CC6378B
MKRPFLWLALLTLGGVQATSYSTLTLSEQAKKAEVIVQATIGTPTTAAEGSLNYTVYPLKVSATLAGDPAQLPQAGGVPALYILSGLDAAPAFQPGQEAVLLLYKGRLDSPLVGFNQGVYWIVNGQIVTGQLLNGPGQSGQLVAGNPNGAPPSSPPALGSPAPSNPPPDNLPPGSPPLSSLPSSSLTAGTATAPSSPALANAQPSGPPPSAPEQPTQSTATQPPAAQPLTSPPPSGVPRTLDELKAAIVAARASR